jgi:predicted nucleotidyltransferase
MYLKNRPPKKIFPKSMIDSLRGIAIQEIKSRLLPDEKIIKIILIGSSVKDSFGEYSPPGFRGSLFSDFDFIIFVDDDYQIPNWLNKEPTAKPFSDDNLNLAYRNRKFINNKYDVELFFIRKSNFSNFKIQELGELVGIPLTKNSNHKYITLYSRN